MLIKIKIKNADELKVGDRVRYKNKKGYCVKDKNGAHMESVGAEYDAEVIQITEHHITFNITVDQSTIRRACVWGPRPYNWSIRKWEINNGFEDLYWERYV